MIQIRNASLSYGSQTVFDDINLTFNETDRIGLVGLNGSGKSTLLKAVGGHTALDEGSITIIGSKSFAYLPQHVVLESSKNVLDEAHTAHKEIWPLEEERRALEKKEGNITPEEGLRFSELVEQLLALEAHKAFATSQETLLGLGFTPEHLKAPVSALSVGWKMRLVLAKLLLQKADFYLFDEPTNHLDIVAKDWFLSFLKQANFGFVLVCHERYFLNQLCSEIVELEFGNATRYKGNYSHYEEQKEHNLIELEQAAKLQQKEIDRKKDTIARFRAKANKARMAKSMEKALDRIEIIELPPSPKKISINLPAPKVRAGQIILTVKNVGHSFGQKQIFKNASFMIQRGQRVALIAPNGVGKTTLFNIITKHYELQTGSIEMGHNVDATIFHQDQDAWLDKHNTIFEEVLNNAPTNKTPEQARTLLGCFLFGHEDISKKIGVLSGGEKNRVSMVKVLLQDANFLLLDEPTNHLDIPSKDILVKALKNYQGTLLFVSHDHDFINDLATHIIALDAHGTKNYHGNYHDYLAQVNAFNAQASATLPVVQPQDKQQKKVHKEPLVHKNIYELQKLSKKLERQITQLEQNIEKTQQSFLDLAYGTPEFDTNHRKLIQLEEELKKTFIEWESIQLQLE
ncbi:MAG: ABC-F family ATP-binding cassette domain-containing protein [Candidatus Babeliales bacterium]